MCFNKAEFQFGRSVLGEGQNSLLKGVLEATKDGKN